MALLLNFRNAIVIINASKICTLWNVSTLQKYDNTCLFIFHYFIVNFWLHQEQFERINDGFATDLNVLQFALGCYATSYTNILIASRYLYVGYNCLPFFDIAAFMLTIFAFDSWINYIGFIRHEQAKITPLKMQCSMVNACETVKCKISLIMILVPLY